MSNTTHAALKHILCSVLTGASVVCSNVNVSSTKLQQNAFSLLSSQIPLVLFVQVCEWNWVCGAHSNKNKRSTLRSVSRICTVCTIIVTLTSFNSNYFIPKAYWRPWRQNWTKHWHGWIYPLFVMWVKTPFTTQKLKPFLIHSKSLNKPDCLKSCVCDLEETSLTGQSGQTPFWMNGIMKEKQLLMFANGGLMQVVLGMENVVTRLSLSWTGGGQLMDSGREHEVESCIHVTNREE